MFLPTVSHLRLPAIVREGPILKLLAGHAVPNWDRLATNLALLLPSRDVWTLFDAAVENVSIALCLHRVSRDENNDLTIRTAELDAFVERAHLARPRTERPWLTLSFDDGYADACTYVESRAPRYPDVEWLLLVCPEKAEHGSGFRWDLDARRHVEDRTPLDVRRENRRIELRATALRRDCRLAALQQCRRLHAFDNATLGNHTNCHFRALSLTFDEVELDYRRSNADFTRLFGRPEHFAFPFGTPGEDFDQRHVELLRGIGDATIWTTARRPYLAEHRSPRAVLPRFPVDGRWSAVQLAFWIAMLSIRAHARGLTAMYPETNRPPASSKLCLVEAPESTALAPARGEGK